MSGNQSPAVFITALFETHLQVKNLGRSMEFYERRFTSAIPTV
jgi:hypothetical protein